jgi:tetratricopeptide (TPR) repeat protein
MSLESRYIRSAVFGLFFLSAFAAAQRPLPDKALLSSFEEAIDQGRYSEVESGLLKFVVSRPDVGAGYELLGRLRFRQDRLNEARSLYQRAVTLDPRSVRARVDLAVTLHRLDDTATAVDILKGIGNAVPVGPTDGLRLAEALVLVREYDDALRTIDRLPPNVKNLAALPFRVESYLALGRRDDIEKVILTANVIARRESEIAAGVAGILVGTAFNKAAADLLSTVLRTAPRHIRALLLMGRAKIYDRDFPQARIHVTKAASLSPESAEAAFLLATIESEQGNSIEALAGFERALELSPGSMEVMSKAVVAAMRANQSRRAVELAREMIRLRPDDPDIIYLFGAASLQSGRIADAEAYLERYTRERPSDGRGCVAYALALAAQPTKIDPARSKLEGCVAMDPANFEATYQLALSHRSSGETEKAIDYLERTVNRAPNYAYAVRDLGVLYLQAGKEAEARVNLEKAAKLAPNDPDTHFQLSRLYNLAGEPVLAKRHFDTFQKLKDQNGN